MSFQRIACILILSSALVALLLLSNKSEPQPAIDLQAAPKPGELRINELALGQSYRELGKDFTRLKRGNYLVITGTGSIRLEAGKIRALCGHELRIKQTLLKKGHSEQKLVGLLGNPEQRRFASTIASSTGMEPFVVLVYTKLQLEAGIEKDGLLSGSFFLGDWANLDEDREVYLKAPK